MHRSLLALALLFASGVVHATTIESKQDGDLFGTGGTKINGLALTTDRYTGWINVRAVRDLVLDIDFTYSAATAIEMTCKTARTSTGANGTGRDVHVITTTAVGGTSTSVPHTWSNATAASENWTWVVTLPRAPYINCLFHATGSPAAGDTIIVYARGATP